MKSAPTKRESTLRPNPRLAFQIILLACAVSAAAQSASPAPSNSPAPQTIARPTRSAPPTRDPHSPGYVAATELPDGAVPPANVDGNFIIGPTHPPAPQIDVHAGVPQGTIIQFTMNSADSKFYPGIAREPGTFGTPDPSESRQIDCHHQPSCALHAPRHGVCPQTICPRHRRSVHCWRGRT